MFSHIWIETTLCLSFDKKFFIVEFQGRCHVPHRLWSPLGHTRLNFVFLNKPKLTRGRQILKEGAEDGEVGKQSFSLCVYINQAHFSKLKLRINDLSSQCRRVTVELTWLCSPNMCLSVCSVLLLLSTLRWLQCFQQASLSPPLHRPICLQLNSSPCQVFGGGGGVWTLHACERPINNAENRCRLRGMHAKHTHTNTTSV